MAESEIVLNWHVFVFIVRLEIEENVPFKTPETSPLAIFFLFFVSRVQSAKYIYFYVENVLRATKNRAVSHPAVYCIIAVHD